VAAYLSPKDLAKLLDKSKLAQYTKHTYTKMRDLKLDLERTHKTGYSVNDEETVAGAFIVGAPVFDSQSSVCGAISVNIPTARCSAAWKKQLIASVIDVGKRISADLAGIGFVR
jgi:IclR family acetate operon transcriptional repressor